MNIKLVGERKLDHRMMRDVYASTLMQLAGRDSRVVALDADLMNSMGMVPFGEAFPDRTFNVGVQEANMVGVAAGLSATGKVPFAHSFGPFATRKAYDATFISGAYARLSVRIVGSDPGITAAYNGGTHMPFEDMGIMRNIPTMTVLEPVDGAMLENLLLQLVDLRGMFYIRLLRRNPVQVYEYGSTFDIGRGVVLRDGSDATIMSSGILVDESLKAAESLESKGISCRVVNLFTIKPIDRDLVAACAAETGAVVTCENHNVFNGLGSAVAETLVETVPVPMERIGSQDQFGEVGPVEYLMKRYEMGAEDIAKRVVKVLRRKRGA
jgi:transketolase